MNQLKDWLTAQVKENAKIAFDDSRSPDEVYKAGLEGSVMVGVLQKIKELEGGKRYFTICVSNGKNFARISWVTNGGKFPKANEVEDYSKSGIKGEVVITNIQELSEQDYNDWKA